VEERLDLAVSMLSRQGFTARWERDGDGYVLHQVGCPYHSLGRKHREVCQMDLTVVATATGLDAERVQWRQTGDEACTIRLTPTD
jgi:predicted ArsR family transcriptional regulator